MKTKYIYIKVYNMIYIDIANDKLINISPYITTNFSLC